MDVYFDGIIYSLQRCGGISRYANELISRVAKQPNVDVSVFLHHINLQLPKLSDLVSVEWVSALPTIFPYGIGKYISYPLDYINTNKFLAQKKYNEGIFHSTYFSYYPTLKIPQVITVHDLAHELYGANSFRTKIFNKHKIRVINEASSIICISQSTANDLVDYYSIPKEKVSVVHLGLSDLFAQRCSEEDKMALSLKYKLPKSFLLYVGNRGWYKNFTIFLDAYSRWSGRTECKLVLAGGGVLTEFEKKQISNFRVENLVNHFENFNDKELSVLYQSSRAFIFPSLYEGFGLPIIEAMASGVPVLASNIPVFKEVGLDVPDYFDPRDINSIIGSLDNIDVLSKDQRMLDRGRLLAKSYSWDITAKKTLDCYNRLVK